MNYVTNTRQRNHRFTEAFRRAAADDRMRRSVAALLDEVINSPVERGFFVSVDHLIVMDRRRREGKLPPMGRERTEMWLSIFSQFDAYLAAHPRATRTDAACEVIARGRAPRFYISRRMAKSLIKNAKIYPRQ